MRRRRHLTDVWGNGEVVLGGWWILARGEVVLGGWWILGLWWLSRPRRFLAPRSWWACGAVVAASPTESSSAAGQLSLPVE